MRQVIRLLFVLFTVAVLISGCQKDEVTDNPMDDVYNISFSRNALDYINIPVGKYFIYKVSGQIALDSVAVVSSQLDTVNMPRNDNTNFPEHNIERFRIRINQYQNNIGGPGTLITEWLRGTTNATPFSPYDSSSTADVRLEFSNSTIGKTIFFATHNVTGSTLTVEGVTYTGVVMAESDNGLPISDAAYKKNTFYWAKGVGIIKRVTVSFNGHEVTMTLLRHN